VDQGQRISTGALNVLLLLNPTDAYRLLNLAGTASAGALTGMFNPITGRCAAPGRTLTVVAPTAAEADALSTAFALMDDAGIAAVLPRVRDVKVHISTRVTTREITAAADHGI